MYEEHEEGKMQDHIKKNLVEHVEVVSMHIFHIPLFVGLQTQIPDL